MKSKINQDRPPNFRSADGRLYLVRCFACEPTHGKENYLPAVASGLCAWCGSSDEVEISKETPVYEKISDID